MREDQQALEAARATAARIEGLTLSVTARASDDGRLFGSVTAQDVVEFLDRHQVPVEKRRVQLDEPIKTLGEYKVPVRLHGDVTAMLAVAVTRRVARRATGRSAMAATSSCPGRSRRRTSRRSGRCSGAILLEPALLPRAIEVLVPDEFYKDAHRQLFAAMIRLFERGEPADVITVTEELRREGVFEEIGGHTVLATLQEEGDGRHAVRRLLPPSSGRRRCCAR